MNAALKIQTQQPRVITWDDYERTERKSDVRHEFVNGQVFAMAGGSWNHNRVATSIVTDLSIQLRGKKCEAFINDLKLRIELGNEEFGYYPDVMVVCDKKDQRKFHVTNPTVVFEVLSKSTARIDRREKLLAYQGVSELQVYVLVEQTHPQLIVYRRSNLWSAETLEGLEAVLPLPEIGVELSLASIYERVDWDEVESDEVI